MSLSHNGATNHRFAVARVTLRIGKSAAQSRIRKELVACLKYDLLVWMSTRTPSRHAVAEPDGEVRPLGIIPNRLESIRKLVRKVGAGGAGARPVMRPVPPVMCCIGN